MSLLSSIIKPIAYASVPLILIKSIASTSALGHYYVRLGLYVSSLSIVAVCGFALAIGMALAGRAVEVQYFVARTFYYVIGRILDLDVQVEGEENLDVAQPAILMANHQSMVDVFVVGRLMPKRGVITAKDSLKYTPLGPFMIFSGSVFLDRGNNKRAVESLTKAAERVRNEKLSIWLFPEGTRTLSKEPNVLPLKKGGFHLAIQSGAPIVPIVTENYWNLYRPGIFRSGTIRVKVLPPIPTKGMTSADISSLADLVRQKMLDALRDMASPSGSPKSLPPTPPSSIPQHLENTSSSSTVVDIDTDEDEKKRHEVDLVKPVGGALATKIVNTGQKKLRVMADDLIETISSETTTTSSPSPVTNDPGLWKSLGGPGEVEDEGLVLVGRPASLAV